MPELSPPADMRTRHAQRIEAITLRQGMISKLAADQRLDLAALALQDTEFGYHKYVGDELALALRLSPWTGARLLDEAEMFAAFPCVHARIGDDTWSMDHADAVLDELAGSGLGHEDCEQVVALVVSQPDAVTPHQLRGAVRAAIMLLDLEAACRRAEKVRTDRDVRAWDGKDGSGCALVSGPKALVAALMASLDALTWPKQPEDGRTASQRRFDALMDLVCGRLLPGQWQAQVIVAISTIEGADSQLAEIPGLGLITAAEERVRSSVCEFGARL